MFGGLFQALAAAVALMAPPGPPEPSYVGPVDRHIKPYLDGKIFSVSCASIKGEGGSFHAYAGGAFTGVVSLDRKGVCQPLRKLWRLGWPSSEADRWYLAWAILTVAHEAGHVTQDVEGWTAPAGSGTLGFEYDAECRAARTYTRWAKRLGVETPSERAQLVQIVQPRMEYEGHKTPARCWEGR